MNMSSSSNVFYLPAPSVVTAPVAPPSRWSVFQARAFCAWARFRLTVREVTLVIRHAGRRFDADYPGWLDAVVPLTAPVPRFARPARVIDFESARLRLRPPVA
jgi:hypothetical protein